MSRGEVLTYDICKLYFLGIWSFWTTSRKKTGDQNSRTLTTHLYSRLNFSSLKDWSTVANYFFYKKCFSELLLHNRAGELIRCFPSSECDFWTMNKQLQEKCLTQVILFTSTQTERKWLTSRFSTVFDFVMRYKYLKTPFFSVLLFSI